MKRMRRKTQRSKVERKIQDEGKVKEKEQIA